jgi:hypothetical protein
VSVSEGKGWTQAINAVSLSDKYAAYRSYATKTDGTGIYAEVCRTNQPMRLTQEELGSVRMRPRIRQCAGGWPCH